MTSIRCAVLGATLSGLMNGCAVGASPSTDDPGDIELASSARADGATSRDIVTRRASETYVRVQCDEQSPCSISLGADWLFDQDELALEGRSQLASALRNASAGTLIPVLRITGVQMGGASEDEPERCAEQVGFVTGPVDANAREIQVRFAADGAALGDTFECAFVSASTGMSLKIERVDPSAWNESQMTFRLNAR